MIDFLINPFFKFCLLPIGSAILGVGVKFISRNDQYGKFKKEDIAVGLDLALTACLMFVVLTTDRAAKLISTNNELAAVLKNNTIDPAAANALQMQAQQLSSQIASSGWLIFLMFLGLLSFSTLVRKQGWKSETEMDPFIGIALPLLFGVLTIIGVMAGATS